MAIARFNPDGSLDKTFGGDGKVKTCFELPGYTSGTRGEVVELLPHGRILVGGTGGFTFNGAGTQMDDDTVTSRTGISIQRSMAMASSSSPSRGSGSDARDDPPAPNGDLVVVGYTYSPNEIAVAVINPNGTPVNSFSGDGADRQ